MEELIQFLRIVYTVVHGVIVLKAAAILPGRLTAGDTHRAQIRNFLHRKEWTGIENMSCLAAAVADNALLGLLKSAGIQRVRVISEGGQAQLDPPLLLALLFLRRFGFGEGVVVAQVFRIVLQCAQPLEGLFIGAISDLAEKLVGILLKV